MLGKKYVNLISYICVGRGVASIGKTKVRDLWKYKKGILFFASLLDRSGIEKSCRQGTLKYYKTAKNIK